MESFQTTDGDLLREHATIIRQLILQSLTEAGSGHLGASLGLADLFTTLYFSVLRHDPSRPHWPERDRLVLSIGHAVPVLYATLAHAGYFKTEELQSLRKLGSRLQGHPGRDHGLPGLELSAGSLGQGLSVAIGMALAARFDGSNHTVFVVMGDGELQEGSVWEAAMAASHHHLDNLVAIVDRNGVQIDGPTEKVMHLEPLADKWKSFGWQVAECDGHNREQLIKTLEHARNATQPAVVLAHTILGKGIPEIEGDYKWHGKVPSREQLPGFLKDLHNINKT